MYKLLEIAQKCNNFVPLNSIPILHKNYRVGYIKQENLKIIQQYTGDLFNGENPLIFKDLSFEELSSRFEKVVLELRDLNIFPALRKWRNELYVIYDNNGKKLFTIERCAVALFAFISHGVHLNVYNYDEEASVDSPEWKLANWKMWIARRSPTKDLYPNTLDQIVAGGLNYPLDPMQCLLKECVEEANLHFPIGDLPKLCGTVSYFNEIKGYGVYPEIQYVFDLKKDVDPKNNDGEVQSFQLMTLQEVLDAVISEEFKPNCGIVIIDFMIRHGIIIPKKGEESIYLRLLEEIHRPLYK
jgi:8-oxo-dGTP pyrophosphatase MutT (NUDIX family)